MWTRIGTFDRYVEMVAREKKAGPWALQQRLGAGGNGVVWQAIHQRSGETAAVKILRNPKERERLARFRNEVGFLLQHQGVSGVLPMIDHDLDGAAPWYATPIATPLTKALGRDPEPRVVLSCVATVAEALTDLATRGIGHRDIKPDNLFMLNGSCVVGDFGLVAYPEQEPLTKQGRRLGPTDFMAPEMRADADRADPHAADVYSLAKSIWVLLTSEQRPLPGPHRRDDEAYAIARRVIYDRAPELDQLLERATRHEPSMRPSMGEIADELNACLSPPPEGALVPNMDELARRIEALTADHQAREARRGDYQRTINATFGELKDDVLSPTYHDLARHLSGFGSTYTRNLAALEKLGHVSSTHYQDGWGGTFYGESGGRRVHVTLAIALRVHDEDGAATIGGLLRIQGPSEPWSGVGDVQDKTFRHDVTIGSAVHRRAVQGLAHELAAEVPQTLSTVASLLAQPKDRRTKD